jgi:hypothetical protein
MPCPNCGEHAGVPLVWGDPDEKTRAAVLRGEIVLAGCMIEPISGAVPDYACLKCAYRWRDE